MKLIRTMLALAVSGPCFFAFAQPSRAPAVPAAPAAPTSTPAPAGSPPMTIEGEWRGPFQDTKVLKMVDTEEGVACYFYVPHNVPSTTSCSGHNDCATHYPSGVGSMSCVKVRAPQPAAKAASKPRH